MLSASQVRYKRGFSYTLISCANTDACSLVFMIRKATFLRLRYVENHFDRFYLVLFFARDVKSQGIQNYKSFYKGAAGTPIAACVTIIMFHSCTLIVCEGVFVLFFH